MAQRQVLPDRAGQDGVAAAEESGWPHPKQEAADEADESPRRDGADMEW